MQQILSVTNIPQFGTWGFFLALFSGSIGVTKTVTKTYFQISEDILGKAICMEISKVNVT